MIEQENEIVIHRLRSRTLSVTGVVLIASFVALAIGLRVPPPARANALSFGTVVQDSIATAGEEDVVMVRRWRDRWATLAPIPREGLSAEERLADLPRPGAPARITADQVCRIVALASEDPEDTGRPISQWTSREIADEVKKRGIVKEISPRHAARLLKRRGSQAASDPLLADALS